MKILLTNDDGIAGLGLIAMAKAVENLGEVQVVAPERRRSAIGHAITLHKPLRMDRNYHSGFNVPAYETNGTPADAVMLGYYELFERDLDLIISGINDSPNLGEDITYSGTVSGGMEASIIGVPSIAVSMGNHEPRFFDEAAAFVAQLASMMLNPDFPRRLIFNVNFPDLPLEKIKGVRITRLGHRWYTDVVTKRKDPRGSDYYWICGDKEFTDNEIGTDCRAIEDHEVSITPLTMDMTDHQAVKDYLSWESQLNKKFAFGR
jgi:5'-nucleotidase